MRALLMYPDRDFNLQQELPCHAQALTQDLELATLLRAMASEDEFLFDVARIALLSGLQNDTDTVLYRQEIVRDCLKHPAVVRQLYDLAVEAIVSRKKHWFGGFLSRYPSTILSGAIELMQTFVGLLRKLRSIAEEHGGQFASAGFNTLFTMLKKELSDAYFASIENHLRELKFRDGVVVSAQLGEGNKGANYVLRRARGRHPNWFQRVLGKGQTGHTVRIADRDEAGAQILSELRDRGLNLVANALAQSTDHIVSFFQALRTELAFYVGCVNLHGRLVAKGEPTCFPQPAPAAERRHYFTGLYDVCLTLSMEPRVVGNAVDASGKSLVLITGANQGGKSSFLRSIGLAQLMMQSGMFVGAESCTAALCPALFTHYKRQEDATMKSGKFDEELARMSAIVDHVTPHALLLFNESFAATNDREGAEIARQIVDALLEKHIRVFFVTHLYEFARSCFDRGMDGAIFLRAERLPDGTRTFKLIEGGPLETSYGEDLYRQVFAPETHAVSAA